jgi:hypothetical protein
LELSSLGTRLKDRRLGNPSNRVEMALVLKSQLAPSSAALVGGCCYSPASARGESGAVLERPSLSVWRMARLQTQVNRRGQQLQMRSAALTQQSLSESISPLPETSCEATVSSAKVFEDEARGICCYISPSGEVTCEGQDEGPHFEPEVRCESYRTRVTCNDAPMREVFSYKYVTGAQGKAWCEGKDES